MKRTVYREQSKYQNQYQNQYQGAAWLRAAAPPGRSAPDARSSKVVREVVTHPQRRRQGSRQRRVRRAWSTCSVATAVAPQPRPCTVAGAGAGAEAAL